jgi:aspartyl-tRNA(Asn)/glutamyl-tRNA(Gln) amidotransferase subunit C
MSEETKPESSEIDVAYVANLARIDLTDAEKSQFQTQLTDILHYVHLLDELDVDGIEPTAHATPLFNVMRKDEVGQSLNREDVIANAPKAQNNEFVVPKIIDQ